MAEYIGPDTIHVGARGQSCLRYQHRRGNKIARVVRRRVLDETDCISCLVQTQPWMSRID
jgi:hypothetical protein